MSRSLAAIFDRLGKAEIPVDTPMLSDRAVVVGGSIACVESARRFTAVAHMRAHPNTLARPRTFLRAVRAVWRDQKRTGWADIPQFDPIDSSTH